MKITKKIVDVVILVIFAVILTAVCKCNVPISEKKHSIPASDINILLDMRDGLSDADILTYYKNDIEDVEAIANGNITIYYYDVDLNEDNQIDKIVHICSSLHSGSHGDMLNILVKEGNSYRVALTGTYRLFSQQEQEPLGEINIMENVSEGFHDIRMISDGAEIILQYNGKGYQHVKKTDSLVEQYYGKWKVKKYLGSGVDYHGIELETNAQIKEAEEYAMSMQEKYLGTTIQITEENVECFSAPCEIGYYYADYAELFALYRQPHTMEIVPPFTCANMYLKNMKDDIDILLDGNNMVVLETGGMFFELEKVRENNFFCTEGIGTIEYNGYIYPLSCVEKKHKVYLNVTEIESFEAGTLYTLELQQIEAAEEWGDISMGRRYLGYFYVTEDMIYRRTVETDNGFTEEQTKKWIALIESDEQAFIEQCYAVCSEETVPDVEHENDYHTYIEAVGDLRIFQLYNDYAGGTDDYETIVWQKGKGIVYYEHGTGEMLMHVAFCDDTYYMDAVAAYFVANVPELKTYRAYIERETEGEASLTYHVCAVEGGIPGDEDNYGYLLYVGEQWENHQVNWDWFFVKADLSEIYYYDIVNGSYLTLEEWRTSELYRNLE